MNLLATLPHQPPDPGNSRLIDMLRLIRSENVGPITFFHLIRRYGTAADALKAIPDLAKRGGRKRPVHLCPHAKAETEMEKVELFGARMLSYADADYPALLRTIADPPPVITMLGQPVWKEKDCVAIVGARNASANGCNFTRKLAENLGKEGFIITSGLARGIDTHAHQGALETGTTGVIASGIDIIYPPENEGLYAQMREHGAIISEQPFGMAPHNRAFPGRNRIISGISCAIAIIEAAKRSGSLITAEFALEQGREVFAVPGSPMDPRCHGTNKLIKDGATLLESAMDILEILRGASALAAHDSTPDLFLVEPMAEPDETTIAQAHQLLDEKLGPTPVPIDELMEQTGLASGLIQTILLEKELAGMLERHPGNKVSVLYHQE